jgi:hypothetical protein
MLKWSVYGIYGDGELIKKVVGCSKVLRLYGGVKSLISQSGREPASLSEGRGPGGTNPTPTGVNSRKGTDLFMPRYAEWREPPSDCLCDNTFLVCV